MLNPPVDNDSLFAMLILGTWSLGPGHDTGRFIDSWLLSGSTILNSLLSFGYSPREIEESYDLENQETRIRVLSWNTASLLHLK